MSESIPDSSPSATILRQKPARRARGQTRSNAIESAVMGLRIAAAVAALALVGCGSEDEGGAAADAATSGNGSNGNGSSSNGSGDGASSDGGSTSGGATGGTAFGDLRSGEAT